MAPRKDKDLEEKVNEIHRAVDDIRRVVVGNAEYKHKGLIERVEDLEVHSRAENKRLLRWVGASGAGGSILGFGLSKIGSGKALVIIMKLFGV